MENVKEYIICSAIWYRDDKLTPHYRPKNVDSGIVFSGHRHPHCIAQASKVLYDNFQNDVEADKRRKFYLKNKTQGFLTSHNNFVNRKEAMIIAIRENQLLNPDTTRGNILYSEDIY